MSRTLCWFSCGAASAYATYLSLQEKENIQIAYCRVLEEHDDNLKFLKQFENKLDVSIDIVMNEKYEGSIYKVFSDVKFIKGPSGAPCTRLLKKEVRKNYQRHDDIQVFGYTVEEENRAERFIDSNNDVDVWFPLIEKGITKQECLEFIKDMGFSLPKMYKLGYSNNNCIGCVKGGMGYWNAIRVDFPEVFDKMSKQERLLNHALLKDKDGPVFLDELEPDRGNFKRDMPGDCGFTCEWKQETLF